MLDQVKAIQRNSEYEVVVFRPQSSKFVEKEYVIDGITVHRFPIKATPSYLFNGLYNSQNSNAFVKTIKLIYGKYTDEFLSNIVFVHCHTAPYGIYGLALKKLAPQIKVILQHHDLDPFIIRNGKFARWSVNAKFRARNSLKLINDADLNVCISTPCKDNLMSFPKARDNEVYQSYLNALKPLASLPKAQPKGIYILYNGVDRRLFNSNANLNKHNLSDKTTQNEEEKLFRIGCIANFNELKDHMTLIKAFEELHKKGYSDIVLSLLGTGETRQMCEDYLRKHSLMQYIELPKEVTHDKLPDYYRSLDLFVLPSYFEGFGCVYTEAAACGVPFMGVFDQGAAEYIAPEERVEWLIAPHDFEQLAKNIEKYYKQRKKQLLCQPYDIDVLIMNYLEYLKKHESV